MNMTKFIVGPEKTNETVMSLLRILNTPIDSLTFPLEFNEIKPGDNYDGVVSTAQSIHSPTCIAYRFERDGAAFCYTGDTAPADAISKLAQGCDLLIHDSAFPEDMADKAKKSNHSTSVGAATIAKQAGVKSLVLFHWSSINEGKEDLLVRQAKKVFTGKVILARDGLEIKL